jgi:hypothetical protein
VVFLLRQGTTDRSVMLGLLYYFDHQRTKNEVVNHLRESGINEFAVGLGGTPDLILGREILSLQRQVP